MENPLVQTEVQQLLTNPNLDMQGQIPQETSPDNLDQPEPQPNQQNHNQRSENAPAHPTEVTLAAEPAIKKVENEEDENSSPSSKIKGRSPHLKQLAVDTQYNFQTAIVITEAPAEETNNANPDAPIGETGLAHMKKCYSQNEIPLISNNNSNDKQQQQQKVIGLKRVGSADKLEIPKPAAEENKQQEPQSANQKQKISINDFTKITSLGRGSYAEVFLVKKVANNKLYALKALDKNFMLKEKKQYQAHVEKEVLLKMNHPNIIKIYSSFQDDLKLYFVLEYVNGGEFADYLRVQGKLPREQIVFFAAEIVNVLEYIHIFGIAHRDMKPENILLTKEGHLKCIDFGTAKFLNSEKRTADLYSSKGTGKMQESLDLSTSNNSMKRNHRSTFVGTAQYVSPEMLEGSDCGAPADLWSLGCMLYLMAVGRYPFADANEYLIFQKIKNVTLNFPEDMDPEIKDLVQKLLVKDPNSRLGSGIKDPANGYEVLKAHPLFKGVDFSRIHEQNPPVIEIASPHKRRSHELNPIEVITPNPQQNRKHYNSDDLSQTEPKSVELVTDRSVKVILSGLVLKKGGWLFYNPRQLILNSKPKLVYYDPDSNQLKGEIILAPTTKAELESKTKFVVTAPNKKYTFKEMEHSAEKWVELINNTVKQLYAKKPGN